MRNQNYKKYPGERVYAEGFGPDSKLIKFFKTSVLIPPKTAGIVSLLIATCLVIFLSASIFPSFFKGQQINQAAFIKPTLTNTVKTASIVANGNPVAWTTLVKRSDIKPGQYLLKLPKSATNIKITTITAKQAKAVLQAQSKEQLSLKQRQELAIATEEQNKQGFLAKISIFLFAGLSEAVQNLADAVILPDPADPDVQITEDAVIVDLSAEAVTEPEPVEATPEPEETPAEPELPEQVVTQEPEPEPQPEEQPQYQQEEDKQNQQKTEKKEDKEQPAQDSDEEKDEKQPDKNSEDQPTEEPETPAEFGIPETPAEEPQIPNTDLLDTTSPSDLPAAVLPEQNAGGPADPEVPSTPSTELTPEETEEEFVKIEYQTPAPEITEQATDTGKLVTVSSEDSPGQPQLTDVLASTKIPELFRVGQENKIKIKWKNNNDQNVSFHAYDTDNNGKLDYVEWTVPHLSEQIFEIIFISKAFEMDENLEITADIYEEVKEQDNVWVIVPQGHYIRATFERVLDSAKDNTIYARPSAPRQGLGDVYAGVEVYPVYTDAQGNQTQGSLVATFPVIDREDTYKVLLTNLQEPTDMFDLKVTGGDLEVDWVVDPTPATVTDNFDDSTKIASSSDITVANGVVTLSASSTWACGDNLIDSRDGKTYGTVLFGTQCWMRTNLNVGTLTAGANTQGTDCPSAAEIEKYCYSDAEGNCTTYGGLYQWDQAMCGSTVSGSVGICPTGWHIPTHDEYTTLELAVCTSGSCATDFPYDTTTTGYRGTNEGTTLKTVNSSSFSGLLAGNRSTNGSFNNLGTNGDFWSSLQSGSNAWRRNLGSGEARVYRNTGAKTVGFSVRCLKN